ncbi:uncharacterized protein DNG_07994 [Cephalotrichum gorgonifer]|uniref:NB-ARC domain-containing protein n=1 Tax=Cephalotrichum gorgonifer TaxID=2041049 RepID=A0AAE8N5N8_9PEZI|nr:uncharacterized protein DNG_07994 [Cephalotrichum gorgonifer]
MSDAGSLSPSMQSSITALHPELSPSTEALCHAADNILKFLVQLTRVTHPQDQVFMLHTQAKLFAEVCHDLDEEALTQRRYPKDTVALSTADKFHLQRLWESINIVSEQCYADPVSPLQDRLRSIVEAYPDRSDPEKKLKLPLIDLTWYDRTVQLLKDQTDTLKVLQTAVSLVHLKSDVDYGGGLPPAAREAAATIRSLISSLEFELGSVDRGYDDDTQYMRTALLRAKSIEQTLPQSSINQHFRVPRSANRIYTGRRQQLQIIENAFPTSYSPTQRRFVIQGAPGSGKTELALKYAEEYMTYYWGVFWVDASTRANATHSYTELAKIGGVEPNEHLAKHWLSSSAYPWLLIIDNADDDEVILEELFPPGHRGCVLITTRNPAHVNCGTAGQKYLELGQMEGDDARDLLLRAANEPQPWTTKAVELAMAICRHLHFLPLALVHAGMAIGKNLCSLADYIPFFEGHAKRIRRERNRRRDRSTSREKRRMAEDEESMSIFGSFEILYQSLAGAAVENESFGDALQILQVFSYMHFQNIRLDTLIHATTSPLLEAIDVEEQKQEMDELVQRLGIVIRRSWRAWVRDVLRSVSARLATPPVLPDALKNPENLDVDELKSEVKDRLRGALVILVSRSLVMKVARGDDLDGTDRYHMHPLVHKWVRERPQVSAAQAALHCQSATTILARSVRLVGPGTEDEATMKRELKPHIDHVRECAVDIQRRMQENQRRNKRFLSTASLGVPSPAFGPLQADECARFSTIYLICGSYTEAELLLRWVHGYVVDRLGHDHELAHRVKLGLAVALSFLTRNNDATDLRREVYESRKKTLGVRHPLTLEVTSELAAGVLSQGRMTESLNLSEAARDGLREAYGATHLKTLRCTQQIGRVHCYYLNWEVAVSHFEEATREMERLSGDDAPPEMDVLSCKEDLATALIRLDKKHYQRAEDLMRHVLERRIETLGKEHPYTLLSRAGLGRVLAARGRLDEADRLMSKTLEVAVRNLGDDHLGVLAGKVWYSQVLVAKGELGLAEQYLLEVVDKRKYAKASARDGEHPDRILAVWYLAECLEKKDEMAEALKRCRELEGTIALIGGHGLGPKHRFNVMLSDKIKVLERKIREYGGLEQGEPGGEEAGGMSPLSQTDLLL